MDLKLRKEERLYHKKQIEEVMKKGKSFRIHPFKVIFHLPENLIEAEPFPLKLGISVPKKLFNRAVDRNLLKRRVREAFRLNRNSLKEALMGKQQPLWVFIIYTDNSISDYHLIETKIILTLQRLQAIHE